VIYDTITVDDDAEFGQLPAVKVGEEGDTSNAWEEEGNDSNGLFGVSETGGDVAETGGLGSAGEEDEETEGVPMDLL
jgi:hypothetical protein